MENALVKGAAVGDSCRDRSRWNTNETSNAWNASSVSCVSSVSGGSGSSGVSRACRAMEGRPRSAGSGRRPQLQLQQPLDSAHGVARGVASTAACSAACRSDGSAGIAVNRAQSRPWGHTWSADAAACADPAAPGTATAARCCDRSNGGCSSGGCVGSTDVAGGTVCRYCGTCGRAEGVGLSRDGGWCSADASRAERGFGTPGGGVRGAGQAGCACGGLAQDVGGRRDGAGARGERLWFREPCDGLTRGVQCGAEEWRCEEEEQEGSGEEEEEGGGGMLGVGVGGVGGEEEDREEEPDVIRYKQMMGRQQRQSQQQQRAGPLRQQQQQQQQQQQERQLQQRPQQQEGARGLDVVRARAAEAVRVALRNSRSNKDAFISAGGVAALLALLRDLLLALLGPVVGLRAFDAPLLQQGRLVRPGSQWQQQQQQQQVLTKMGWQQEAAKGIEQGERAGDGDVDALLLLVRGLEHCVTALLNMSLVPGTSQVIATSGGISILACVLQLPADCSSGNGGGGTCSNGTTNTTTSYWSSGGGGGDWSTDGAGERAGMLLEGSQLASAEAQQSVATSKANTAAALFVLSAAEEHRELVREAGAIPLLVQLLVCGSLRARKDSALALFHLSRNARCAADMVRAGAVDVLLSLLHSPGRPEPQQQQGKEWRLQQGRQQGQQQGQQQGGQRGRSQEKASNSTRSREKNPAACRTEVGAGGASCGGADNLGSATGASGAADRAGDAGGADRAGGTGGAGGSASGDSRDEEAGGGGMAGKCLAVLANLVKEGVGVRAVAAAVAPHLPALVHLVQRGSPRTREDAVAILSELCCALDSFLCWCSWRAVACPALRSACDPCCRHSPTEHVTGQGTGRGTGQGTEQGTELLTGQGTGEVTGQGTGEAIRQVKELVTGEVIGQGRDTRRTAAAAALHCYHPARHPHGRRPQRPPVPPHHHAHPHPPPRSPQLPPSPSPPSLPLHCSSPQFHPPPGPPPSPARCQQQQQPHLLSLQPIP
ncbi:unnamed protein product [Closterium sp. Naga37s-1]|nr:unnamed protein product [Closterium sp. Naga37s-1]